MPKDYEPYIECRCIPHELIKDINKLFDEFTELKTEKYGFSKATAEQINAIEQLVQNFKEEEKNVIRANLIHTIENPQETKTIEFIKRYLSKCECPNNVNINYKDGFHSYKNIKVMLEHIMGK